MTQKPVPLTQLPKGCRATVVQIDGSVADYLSGFGLYPGVELKVHQRFPSFVIKADETELAIESDVAMQILVIR